MLMPFLVFVTLPACGLACRPCMLNARLLGQSGVAGHTSMHDCNAPPAAPIWRLLRRGHKRAVVAAGLGGGRGPAAVDPAAAGGPGAGAAPRPCGRCGGPLGCVCGGPDGAAVNDGYQEPQRVPLRLVGVADCGSRSSSCTAAASVHRCIDAAPACCKLLLQGAADATSDVPPHLPSVRCCMCIVCV